MNIGGFAFNFFNFAYEATYEILVHLVLPGADVKTYSREYHSTKQHIMLYKLRFQTNPVVDQISSVALRQYIIIILL